MSVNSLYICETMQACIIDGHKCFYIIFIPQSSKIGSSKAAAKLSVKHLKMWLCIFHAHLDVHEK